MIQSENLGIILEKTTNDFENQAVLNPACIKKNGITHMYYRAVRQGNFSSIGYCQLDGTRIMERWDRPLLEPEYHFERHGIEDPRIVEYEGTYYLFYTAYDGQNVHAAYATSRNLIHFEKQGTISPAILYKDAVNLFRDRPMLEKYFWYEKHYEQAIDKNVLLWEKDVFMFPQKFNGNFLLVHRLMPGIQLMPFKKFSDLTIEFWENYLGNINQHILLNPQYWFESRKIGSGCPPILTDHGWLLIFHAVEDSPHGNVYRASAALLDKNNPSIVLGRLKEPLFSPTENWEKQGDTSNVVFPTGAIVQHDALTIFYGAADTRIAARQFSLSKLISELILNPTINHGIKSLSQTDTKTMGA